MTKSVYEKLVLLATAIISVTVIFQCNGWAVTPEHIRGLAGTELENMIAKFESDKNRREKNIGKGKEKIKKIINKYSTIQRKAARAWLLVQMAGLKITEGTLKALKELNEGKKAETVWTDDRIGDNDWKEAIRLLQKAEEIEAHVKLDKQMQGISHVTRKYPGKTIGQEEKVKYTIKEWIEYWKTTRNEVYYKVYKVESPYPKPVICELIKPVGQPIVTKHALWCDRYPLRFEIKNNTDYDVVFPPEDITVTRWYTVYTEEKGTFWEKEPQKGRENRIYVGAKSSIVFAPHADDPFRPSKTSDDPGKATYKMEAKGKKAHTSEYIDKYGKPFEITCEWKQP